MIIATIELCIHYRGGREERGIMTVLRVLGKLNKEGDIGTVFSYSTDGDMGRLGAGIPDERTTIGVKELKSLPHFF